ncbi:major facilitator superfamily domain-containing protein, partial [Kickxella alabastrina]|uniref:major facilitator superfamily domain-containing protein n=1 Tax=Kickxella alabastrina TaxID=61397 RepID=UPI00221E384A
GGILMSLGLFAASYARHVWQLCLTQGLIFGLGVCLTWIPAASAPSSWFEKNRGLATGITHMGLGIGGLVFSPLTRFLLEKAGTSGSLRWLALIILVGVTVTSLGIHSKRHSQRTNEIIMSSTRWSRISVMRSWRFWLLSLGVGFGQAGWYIMLLFMTSISVSVGLDVSNAAMILGAINGASAVGQFLAGYAADLIGPINALVLFTFLATLSNTILFLPHLSFHLLIVYACLCGASIG